jgi:hypothetical protein
MTLLDVNRRVLLERFPQLLIILEKETAKQKYSVYPAKNGNPTLEINGTLIHSTYNPDKEAQRIAEEHLRESKKVEQEDETQGPIFFLGAGLLYSVEAILGYTKNRPLIIVEADPLVLRAALSNRDCETILRHEQLVIICGGRADTITGALDIFSGNPILLRNTAIISLYKTWYTEAENILQNFIQRKKTNIATQKRFGKRWQQNIQKNLHLLSEVPGIQYLKGTLKELPFLLVAAGPSLDLLRPYIHKIKDRTVIVATDTAVRFLLSENVYPDFVMLADPQYWNARHFDSCNLSYSILISEIGAYPSVFNLKTRASFLSASCVPFAANSEQAVDSKDKLLAGGSVATSAWDFCRYLGAKKIWIAGLDLSFPGYRTHFRGALFEEKSHSNCTRIRPAETWSYSLLQDGFPEKTFSTEGQSLQSDKRLSLYAKWFEEHIKNGNTIPSVRLSSIGIQINGLDTESPEQLLKEIEQRTIINAKIEDAINKMQADFFTQEKINIRKNKLEQLLGTFNY